jgi:cytochrome d ubiquinol oxidase subunit I
VYGLVRTADSVSSSLTTGDVAFSLAGYAIVYVFIYSFGFRQMYRMALKGPAGPATETLPGRTGLETERSERVP